VFVYTVWLKPRSSWNAVIGGAAGAAAPLIADAAANGRVGAAGWLLFAIIFFWQPPHVWAIALFRKDDYARRASRCCRT
jgi:protoheme IX farnesyltransferase